MITAKKKLKKDMMVMILIILLPFAFYLYNIVPDNSQIWKTSWFTINSGFHDDIKFYIWLLFVKFMTLSVLSIWFITCSHIWKWVILVPILFEIFKVYVHVKTTTYGYEYNFSLEDSLFYSIPYIVLLIFISKFLGFQKKESLLLINHDINNEMFKLSKFNIKNYKNMKRELNLLDKEKNNLNKKEYLTMLIALRDRCHVNI